jgi:hypothetical protein
MLLKIIPLKYFSKAKGQKLPLKKVLDPIQDIL